MKKIRISKKKIREKIRTENNNTYQPNNISNIKYTYEITRRQGCNKIRTKSNYTNLKVY